MKTNRIEIMYRWGKKSAWMPLNISGPRNDKRRLLRLARSCFVWKFTGEFLCRNI